MKISECRGQVNCWLIAGETQANIAKRLGVTGATVCCWVNKWGLAHNGKYPPKPNFDWDYIQRLYDSGLTRTELFATVPRLKEYDLTRAAKEGKFVYSLRRASQLHALGKVCLDSYRTEEFKHKMSKNGGLKENSGRCKAYYFHSRFAGIVALNGTWELQYAAYLELMGIAWSRPGENEKFSYTYEGKERFYYPDFYLTESAAYVEVKGYKTKLDACKWDEFTKTRKLLILEANALLALIPGFTKTRRSVKVLDLQGLGLSVPLKSNVDALALKPKVKVSKPKKEKIRKLKVRSKIPRKLNKDWKSFGDIPALVWQLPLVKLGALLGVSDVGLKKYCKRTNISLPPRGYWRRIELGYTHEEALNAQH